MILFQIENLNLFKTIIDYKFEPQETVVKGENDTPYAEGGRRDYDNKTKRMTIKITGKTTSQHFLHGIKALAKRDNAKGEVKVFFIEKYSKYDDKYNTLSTNTKDNQAVKIHFTYAHIDPSAFNDFKQTETLGDVVAEYKVDFSIDLIYTDVFDITRSANAFLYDKSQTGNILNYDSNFNYDEGNNYDSFITNIQTYSLQDIDNQNSLVNYYDKITCCNCKEDIKLYFIDNVIEPFYMSNLNVYSGTMLSLSSITGKVEWAKNKTNVFQGYLPLNSSSLQQKQLDLYKSYDGLLANLDIQHLNKSNNTWNKNGVIQIFRLVYVKGQAVTNEATQKLFYAEGQVISLSVFNGQSQISNINIKVKKIGDEKCFNSLYGIFFLPHLQKFYGRFTPFNININNIGFEFNNNFSSQLVDLDKYFLEGQLEEFSQSKTNDYFRQSPTYKLQADDNLTTDFIYLENKNPTNNAPLTNSTIFFQIYSLDQNSLI